MAARNRLKARLMLEEAATKNSCGVTRSCVGDMHDPRKVVRTRSARRSHTAGFEPSTAKQQVSPFVLRPREGQGDASRPFTLPYYRSQTPEQTRTNETRRKCQELWDENLWTREVKRAVWAKGDAHSIMPPLPKVYEPLQSRHAKRPSR
ncbi:hypothetical protein MTO96_042922 [Rhipicephalus appendiculatus]